MEESLTPAGIISNIEYITAQIIKNEIERQRLLISLAKLIDEEKYNG